MSCFFSAVFRALRDSNLVACRINSFTHLASTQHNVITRKPNNSFKVVDGALTYNTADEYMPMNQTHTNCELVSVLFALKTTPTQHAIIVHFAGQKRSAFVVCTNSIIRSAELGGPIRMMATAAEADNRTARRPTSTNLYVRICTHLCEESYFSLSLFRCLQATEMVSALVYFPFVFQSGVDLAIILSD